MRSSEAVDGRPELQLIAPGASAEEAAAIVGALEMTMQSAEPPEHRPAEPSPWVRAGLVEGVDRGRR